MLQFWLPRTAKFEQAIIDSFRIPFVLGDYDLVSEKVSLSILTTISRFEKAQDIPESVVAGLITDEALRNRIASSSEIREQIEIVESALAAQLSERDRRIEDLKEQAAKLEAELTATSIEKQAAKAQVHSTASEIESLQLKIARLVAEKDEEKVQGDIRRIRNINFGALFLIPFLGVPLSYAFVARYQVPLGLVTVCFNAALAALVLGVNAFVLAHKTRLASAMLAYLRVPFRTLGAIGWILVSGVVVNYVYDLLKALFAK